MSIDSGNKGSVAMGVLLMLLATVAGVAIGRAIASIPAPPASMIINCDCPGEVTP